jgi:hypothetical protein
MQPLVDAYLLKLSPTAQFHSDVLPEELQFNVAAGKNKNSPVFYTLSLIMSKL